MSIIYKIMTATEWRRFTADRRFEGASIDLKDGFIHFSGPGQVEETARRHFAGQRDLVLVAVDGASLGPALRYEISRGNALFPHLYAPLAIDAVLWVRPIGTDEAGMPVLPERE